MLASVVVIDIETIQAEARQLVDCGKLGRHQPIYSLCSFFPSREREIVERELAAHDYLLRDRVIYLLSHEDWSND
jgi:hypothetical protein